MVRATVAHLEKAGLRLPSVSFGIRFEEVEES
jgi:hypothetical protein